jgi:hypothetical protein
MILVIGTTTIGLCSDFNGVYCKLWGMAFTYPIANIDATPYFKSITTGDEMIGAQTALIVYPGQDVVLRGVPVKAGLLKLNFGGITSLKANGMPYVSISLRTMKITTQSGETITDIAWGYGHDFKENKDHWLIGATFPLW